MKISKIILVIGLLAAVLIIAGCPKPGESVLSKSDSGISDESSVTGQAIIATSSVNVYSCIQGNNKVTIKQVKSSASTDITNTCSGANKINYICSSATQYKAQTDDCSGRGCNVQTNSCNPAPVQSFCYYVDMGGQDLVDGAPYTSNGIGYGTYGQQGPNAINQYARSTTGSHNSVYSGVRTQTGFAANTCQGITRVNKVCDGAVRTNSNPSGLGQVKYDVQSQPYSNITTSCLNSNTVGLTVDYYCTPEVENVPVQVDCGNNRCTRFSDNSPYICSQ